VCECTSYCPLNIRPKQLDINLNEIVPGVGIGIGRAASASASASIPSAPSVVAVVRHRGRR
jgi:hypothetical protein